MTEVTRRFDSEEGEIKDPLKMEDSTLFVAMSAYPDSRSSIGTKRVVWRLRPMTLLYPDDIEATTRDGNDDSEIEEMIDGNATVYDGTAWDVINKYIYKNSSLIAVSGDGYKITYPIGLQSD